MLSEKEHSFELFEVDNIFTTLLLCSLSYGVWGLMRNHFPLSFYNSMLYHM